MILLFIYIYLLRISFVFTNQLNEPSASSTELSSNENIRDIDDDIATAIMKQARNRASVPQSLTLLMNFKDDGTTSFQIMQGKFILNDLNFEIHFFYLF